MRVPKILWDELKTVERGSSRTKSDAGPSASRRFGGLPGAGGGGAVEEEFAFAGVLGEGGSTLEFGFGLGEAAKLEEKIAANRRQQMVVLERSLGGEVVDEFPRCDRADRQRKRNTRIAV